jgi:hypothetical protein
MKSCSCGCLKAADELVELGKPILQMPFGDSVSHVLAVHNVYVAYVFKMTFHGHNSFHFIIPNDNRKHGIKTLQNSVACQYGEHSKRYVKPSIMLCPKLNT